MVATKTKTYSVNIRKKAAEIGIAIKEQSMVDPIASVLMLHEVPTLYVNAHMAEAQKRMAIANAMAVCLSRGEMVNCIVTQEVPESIDAIARRLLMSDKAFLREEKHLQSFGAMRYSILSTLFQVPLAEVLLRARDFSLAD